MFIKTEFKLSTNLHPIYYPNYKMYSIFSVFFFWEGVGVQWRDNKEFIVYFVIFSEEICQQHWNKKKNVLLSKKSTSKKTVT